MNAAKVHQLDPAESFEKILEGSALKSSAEFVRGFTPPDYLIDGMIQRQFLYSLTGQTGAGKSAILLLIAASVATGRPIGGIEVEQGNVIYCAGENPDDIKMRWVAMSGTFGFNSGSIDVHFVDGAQAISKLPPMIEEEADRLGGVSLVIIDTSAAFFEGDDENSKSGNAQARKGDAAPD